METTMFGSGKSVMALVPFLQGLPGLEVLVAANNVEKKELDTPEESVVRTVKGVSYHPSALVLERPLLLVHGDSHYSLLFSQGEQNFGNSRYEAACLEHLGSDPRLDRMRVRWKDSLPVYPDVLGKLFIHQTNRSPGYGRTFEFYEGGIDFEGVLNPFLQEVCKYLRGK